jgi:iron complex outermembrane receptor protein
MAFVVGVLGPAAEVQAQTGTLEGAVVARENGEPAADAVVLVEGTSLVAVANGVGRFRLENVPAGPVVLVVQAQGFLDLRVPDVQVLQSQTLQLTVELETTPNYMERVQVTATKTPLSIGDVAALTDIVDRATIDSRGDQTLTQAISRLPGVFISTQLGIFETVTLRGMPKVGNEFTNTLLLIDGVPQTNSGNDARVVALPINDASSIEVVRGPNSALYGRTAIGGAVNVLTANPTADHQSGFEFTGGQQGMAKGLFNASGPLDDWGGYYVSIASERNSGYFVNLTTDDYTNGNSALFGKITFAPDNQSYGSVSVNRVISDNDTPTNEPIIDGRLLHEIDPRFDRLTNLNIAPGPNYHQEEGRLTVNYTRAFTPNVSFVGIFGYRDVQLKFIEDGDFIGSPYDLEANTLTMYPFSQQQDEDVYYSEGRLELTLPSGSVTHSALVGGSYERNNGKLASDFIFDDPDLFGFSINYLNPVIPPRNDWQHFEPSGRIYHLGITGLFAQYMIEPTPRLLLLAAGRYDRLDMDVTRGSSPKVEETFDAFSPKVSATFKLLGGQTDTDPSVNVYAAYSEAFLPPRRPSSLTPDDVPLDLQPEEITNYEGGLKANLLDGQLSLEATYFWMKEEGVVLTTRQGPFFLPTNAGEQKYKGLETTVGWSTSNVFAYVNAALYRHRFGDFVIESEDGDTDLMGNRLRMSPDYIVNWGLLLTPVSFIDATVNVKHVSDVQVDEDNTFELDPYTLVDASVSWRHGPLRLTLSARNLFNEEYYGQGSDETVDPGRPRQVLLTTSVSFR